MTAEAPYPQAVDVQTIMRDLRARVRGEYREAEWDRQARRAIPVHLPAGIASLRVAAGAVRAAVWAIGQPPPAPPTLRGRLGAVGVNVVRRALFWLMPSIQASQNELVSVVEKHLAATEDLIRVLHQTNLEIARLREKVEAPGTARAAGNGGNA